MNLTNISDLINNFFDNVVFIIERLDLLSVLDVLLVTSVFFVILLALRDTQAMSLLRGVILFIALVSVLDSLDVLPAFAWLISNTLPALVLAIPVIFAPEIRRALERLGRTGTFFPTGKSMKPDILAVIEITVSAASRLSARRHGALIVLQKLDGLQEFVQTGVKLEASVTAELLIQVFFPNTPLHDGAVIISDSRLEAAACVLPLSSSGVLRDSPERPMGLRHRAALGISEVSDAVAVVVSEETGRISISHGGRIIRKIEPDKLQNVLVKIYEPFQPRNFFSRFFPKLNDEKEEVH